MVDTTEKKENKNIFEIVGKLSHDLIYEQSTGKRNVEIECARLLQEQDEKCQNAYKAFYSYSEAVELYSTFDANMIGTMLALFISLVEGRNYSFILTECQYKEPYFGEYEAFTADRTSAIEMLMDSEDFPHWVPTAPNFKSVSSFPKELKEKYGEKENFRSSYIILNRQPSYKGYSQTITFYQLFQNRLDQLVDFGKFSYVKDLIDATIQFRFENNIGIFKEEDLMAFLNVCLGKVQNKNLTEHIQTLKDKMLARTISENN